MHREDSPDNLRSGTVEAPLSRAQVEALDRRIGALADRHRGLLERYVPISDLTTFRIGGPALGLCRIGNMDDARRFQEFSRLDGIPAVSLGGGSNILADDLGFAGIVSRMEYADLHIEAEEVTVGAGLPFDALIRRTLEAGLTGLEFASGIPGSIGGAIVGNAGCFGHEICEFLVRARVLEPDGRILDLEPDALEFAYRRSGLQRRDALLLEATFRLERGDLQAAATVRDRNLALRREKHPVDLPTAGSYFKNLPPLEPGGRRRAAGRLLEAVGAIGLRRGDAAVYEKHANIIVNMGQATASDVLALAAEMQRRVREEFGVDLAPEVRRVRWNVEA